MHLLLRADAGPQIGVGHVMRCLALAEVATEAGWEVSLSGRLSAGSWLPELLTSAGIAQLEPAQTPDALASLAREVDARVVVIDSYGFPKGADQAVRRCGGLLVSVEDGPYGRRPAAIVVDPGIGAETASRPEDGSVRLLRGAPYVLVRRAVQIHRAVGAAETAARRVAGAELSQVLVVMGGTDPAGLTDPVVRLLEQAAPQATVEAMHAPTVDLPARMAAADLVATAAGVTALEGCCLGVPLAVVCAADNQERAYRALVDTGAACGLGTAARLAADPEGVLSDLRRLVADGPRWGELAARARLLVDGAGAARVLVEIERMLSSQPNAAPMRPIVDS